MAVWQNWKWCAVLVAVPLCACAPSSALQAPEARACAACQDIEPNSYAVSKPMAGNDYPVSYRVQNPETSGYAKPVDYQTLTHQPRQRSIWPFDSAK
jgi:hypothetical protein